MSTSQAYPSQVARSPQVVFLQVDPTKMISYVVLLPDGTTLTSTASVINDTWAGAAGAVTLIVPKISESIYIEGI